MMKRIGLEKIHHQVTKGTKRIEGSHASWVMSHERRKDG
jgi:hypothetical protein